MGVACGDEKAAAAAPAVVRLARHAGRLRDRRHRWLSVAVGGVGWLWFGASGALPLLLWWWLRGGDATVADDACCIDLGQVRSARLGRWRTCIHFGAGPALEIFHDEVDPPQLARLRRELKRQLATG
ncbi:MAG: hypothetical protein RIC56_04145 [Pseudomonadales bacterium]